MPTARKTAPKPAPQPAAEPVDQPAAPVGIIHPDGGFHPDSNGLGQGDDPGVASAEEQNQAEINGLLEARRFALAKDKDGQVKAIDASLKRRGYKAEHAVAPKDAAVEQAVVEPEDQ
jgi:hypothetical protein